MYEHPKKEDIHTTGNPLLDSLLKLFIDDAPHLIQLPVIVSLQLRELALHRLESQ